VRRGEVLYAVDGVGVPLLFGDTPAWRSLGSGMSDGVDVLQLERNLVALGYGDDLEVDQAFDAETAAAIEDWQADRGVDDTGVLALGSFAFLPGERRVGGHVAQVGQGLTPGAAVTDTTSTRPAVTVDLPATQRDLASRGEEVTVTMPDDREVIGKIRRVGSVASVPVDDPTAEPTIEVVVSIRRADADEGLDGAPVDVGFASDVQEDAIAVPVAALLALAEGGYALEVVAEDGSTGLVGVEVGLYADGWVEVDGDGIEPGVEVVVAA
jgi:peptidoglycan hydrolase-like protein with peptidoglycan-binding domain